MISSRQKSKDWRDKDVAVRPLWSGRPYGAASEPRDGSSDCGDRWQYMRDDVACVWARGSGSPALVAANSVETQIGAAYGGEKVVQFNSVLF